MTNSKPSSPTDDKKKGGVELLTCLREGDLYRCQGMIMNNCDVNDARDDLGEPALHLAVRKHACGVVKLLLQHKANVNQVCQTEESSALHVATQMGSLIMVKQLIQGKANPDLISMTGETALTKAACSGQLKIIDKLVSEGKCTIDVTERKAKFKNQFEINEEKAVKDGKKVIGQ